MKAKRRIMRGSVIHSGTSGVREGRKDAFYKRSGGLTPPSGSSIPLPKFGKPPCKKKKEKWADGRTDFGDEMKWILGPRTLYGIPVGLAILLYLNSIPAGFVYDDHRAIVSNPDVTGEAPWGSVWGHDFWGSPLRRKGSHGSWRPLTTFSFRLNALFSDFTLSEGQPEGTEWTLKKILPSSSSWHFHATNVILHGLVTGAYLFLLDNVGIPKLVCLWAGSLFAAHPVHVEAVGGIVGRAELLAALAFCLAISAYTFYLRSGPDRSDLCSSPPRDPCPCLKAKEDEGTATAGCRSLLWIWGCVAATALGTMCKEQAITALGVAFILHIALVRGNAFLRKNFYRNVVVECWPTCILAALVVWGRFSLVPSLPAFAPADNPAAHASKTLTRVLTVGRYWVLHARLLLLPDVLSFDWSMGAVPLVSSFVDKEALPVLLLLLVGGVVAARTFKNLSTNRAVVEDKTPDALNNNLNTDGISDDVFQDWFRPSQPIHIAFALALLVVPFLPASNLVAWVGFVAAERVLYLPSMGTSLLVAIGAQNLSGSLSDIIYSYTKTIATHHRKLERRRSQRISLGIVNLVWIFLVLLFGARTLKRNVDWYSEETLYKSGIPICPAKALANLGVVYSDQGRTEEAERAYRVALDHAPQMADTHYNLGLLLAGTNRLEEAKEEFEMALRSRPWLAQAHLALSSTLVKLGSPEGAAKVLESCLKQSEAPAKDGTGHMWAIINCHQRLARMRIQDGRPHDAIEILSRALATAPHGYPQYALFTAMAEAYVGSGEQAEAQEALRKALNSQPAHVPAHLAFSRLLRANGSKTEEAESWLHRAVALAPNDPFAYKHLGQFLLETGRPEAAIGPWLRAATLDPSDHTAAFNSATALRLAGRNSQAEAFYKKAVLLLPEDLPSQRNLGAILHLNGKLDEALRHYELALALAPGDPQTTTNLGRLRALRSKRDLYNG